MIQRRVAVVVLISASAFITACGGGSSKSNTIVSSGPNVATLTVNAGPNKNYANGAFTSVQVCVPSTSTCQTISGILVDTGSSGLRILSSALTISLPQQTGSGGDPVAECLPFVTAYTWGSVKTADITVASETASAVPIQVIGDPNFPDVPTQCSDNGKSADSLGTLGANGLIGVGLALQDCGQACTEAPGTGSQNPGLYYGCPASGCTVTSEPLASQVVNPVSLFATDNNGVIIELPSVNGSESTISGSLVFGIGTESNNAMGSATVYTVDELGEFTTQFNSQSYGSSFIDSGSNGLYFLNSTVTGIPGCGDFYCPSGVDNLSATNVGANEASAPVSFSVANADTLFNEDGGDAVFSQLAGPNDGAFDWGLPFFYGRNVFTAIETKSTPGGTGPFWAY